MDDKKKKKKTKKEKSMDETLKGTFPASDPPSWSPGNTSTSKSKKDNKDD